MRDTINVTRGTDVVLNDRLLFRGKTFDPSLCVNVEAYLVSRAGVRTALGVEIVDDYLVITVPWLTGRVPGLYGLEVRGMSNGLRWATYADSLIRYTTGTSQGGSEEVTVTSDAYDITQQVSYRYGESPISEVRVDVEDSPGPARVEASYVSRVLSLLFKGVKGTGISSLEQTLSSSSPGGENIWTATLEDGRVATLSVRNGSRGNGISSIEQTSSSDADGGENVWLVRESDGGETLIRVRNGSRGNGIASFSEELSSEGGGVNTHTFTDTDGVEHVLHTRNGRDGRDGDNAILLEGESPLAQELSQATDKAITPKAVSDAILPISGIDDRWSWRTGKRMHHATASTLQNDVAFQTSYPLQVNINDVVEVTTVGGITQSFTVIAYLETEDASTWVKKVVQSPGVSTTNTYKWTANADGYVVVCGVINGMEARILRFNRLAKFYELKELRGSLNDNLLPIKKLLFYTPDVTWTEGKFMHPGTPDDLNLTYSSLAQLSSPIPVEIGDQVVLGTYELPSNRFTAIAYAETADASTWVKKATVDEYGNETFHTLKWTSTANGFVRVSGVKAGMTLEIIPQNRIMRTEELIPIRNDISDIKRQVKGTFDEFVWHAGTLHPSTGEVRLPSASINYSYYRYSDYVTLNKGDTITVRTYFNTTGTYTVIADANGMISNTTTGDVRGTVLTKTYTSPVDNKQIRVCVYVGDGSVAYPTKEYHAEIQYAEALATKSELKKAIGESWSLPDYWAEYLSSKMAGFSAGADTFAFVSDTHSAENAGNSGEVLHWLAKNKGVSKVIHGGDICCTGGPSTSFDDVPTNFEQMLVRDIKAYDRLAEKASQYARFFGIKGNHDFFEYGDGVDKGGQTPVDVSRHIKGLMTDLGVRDNMQNDPNSLYYYYDNSIAGIRYIFLDSCHNSIKFIQIGITQLTWLISTLNGTPNNYKVIVIGHSPASIYMAPSTETTEDKIGCVREMLVNANAKASGTYHYYHRSSGMGTEEGDVLYDFSGFKGEVIAYVHGHTHVDNQVYHNGIPFIGIICDKAGQHPYSPFCETTEMAVSSKPVGTAKEQAMDVATINSTKDVISMHRVGIGFDRHFHVGAITLSVGESVTLSPSIITAASFGGADEDSEISNGEWTYKHDFATINPSTGVVTATAQGDVITFAEDEDHNKEFWHIKVTS